MDTDKLNQLKKDMDSIHKSSSREKPNFIIANSKYFPWVDAVIKKYGDITNVLIKDYCSDCMNAIECIEVSELASQDCKYFPPDKEE